MLIVDTLLAYQPGELSKNTRQILVVRESKILRLIILSDHRSLPSRYTLLNRKFRIFRLFRWTSFASFKTYVINQKISYFFLQKRKTFPCFLKNNIFPEEVHNFTWNFGKTKDRWKKLYFQYKLFCVFLPISANQQANNFE